MTSPQNEEEKIDRKIVIFLTDTERTDLKVKCARLKVSMSQQVRELIIDWIKKP
jgi:hypothetical protein